MSTNKLNLFWFEWLHPSESPQLWRHPFTYLREKQSEMFELSRSILFFKKNSSTTYLRNKIDHNVTYELILYRLLRFRCQVHILGLLWTLPYQLWFKYLNYFQTNQRMICYNHYQIVLQFLCTMLLGTSHLFLSFHPYMVLPKMPLKHYCETDHRRRNCYHCAIRI